MRSGDSQTTSTVAPQSAEEEEEDALPHGDPVTKVCLLCQRQFKTVPELEKHNRLSALHKAHLFSSLVIRLTAASTGR